MVSVGRCFWSMFDIPPPPVWIISYQRPVVEEAYKVRAPPLLGG